MGIQQMIEEKKEWRVHMIRVKNLPKEYQLVYKEIQKYFFKVAPIGVTEKNGVLSELVDLFEEGAERGKPVLEVTGENVALFADQLIEEKQTLIESLQTTNDSLV